MLQYGSLPITDICKWIDQCWYWYEGRKGKDDYKRNQEEKTIELHMR